jgi:allantoin racemase
MRIHVYNPNSTASMTAHIEAAARRVAHAGTEIIAVTASGTPPSIEGFADEAMSVPAMLAAIRAAEMNGADAHVIACFDDPGLAAAREVASGPVIGICQAAVQVACTISARFSIVTTLSRSVPIIEDLVLAYGAQHRCRSVLAVDLPVLALEADTGTARMRLLAETRRAVADSRAEAIILGCAGMANLCDWLSKEAGVPVIDGVSVAVKLAEAIVGAGHATSKLGAYAYPRSKEHDLVGAA